MTESVLVTYENKVMSDKIGQAICSGPTRGGRRSYRYPNGSEIVLGGLDKPIKIMSTEYDLIYVAEATEVSEESWQSLKTRLRNGVMPYQQIIADCNPDGPTHWLNQRCINGLCRRLVSKHADNPAISQEYLRNLDMLTGHQRARLLEGLWAAPEGLVYPDFDRCIVSHEQFAIPDDAVFRGGVDFGWNDPFCALLAAVWYEDDERHIYVCYERYEKTTPIGVHAAAMQRAEDHFAAGYCPWYCDSARPDQIRELRDCGIEARRKRMRSVQGAIMFGVDSVTKHIMSGTLHISDECAELIKESLAYSYDPDPAKGGERPLDACNHAMDALRYLVVGVDGE